MGWIFGDVEDMIIRDNSAFLSKFDRQTLFTRPTQMGKSTFLSLANMVYDRNATAPQRLASVPDDANSYFVFHVDFLSVAESTATSTVRDRSIAIDAAFLRHIEDSTERFLEKNKELYAFYKTPNKPPNDPASAGLYLYALGSAVNDCGGKLMVLVDEYDKPIRDVLLDLIGGPGDGVNTDDIKATFVNYISFFTNCKRVGQMNKDNKVWSMGVTPIKLDILSDYAPTNMTFTTSMALTVGLLTDDVDRMLDRVAEFLPFESGGEKIHVRAAIAEHANHLHFLSPTPVYHTRMVNQLMTCLLDPVDRADWLRDLTQYPAQAQYENVPSVFKVIKNNASFRATARALAANREVFAILNKKLSLVDLAQETISEANYLTLLVHLGIVSVKSQGAQHVFKSSSTYYRSKYLGSLIECSLGALLMLSDRAQIYLEGPAILTEFCQALSAKGMKALIKWAQEKKKNNILELQFQAFLVGALHDTLLDVLVATTQEDVLEGGRTDVTIAGDTIVLILELKQKPTMVGPTPLEMTAHQKQLSGYTKEVKATEAKASTPRIVAGFVVVMYNNGKSFHVERSLL
jgi:hypothetical protein